MNLGDIRAGLADLLGDVDGLRVSSFWPDSPQWGRGTFVVVLPDDPYVEYPIGAGRVQSAEIRMRLVCLPLPSQGAERVQAELDELLSCGSDQPRSLKLALDGDISAGGTACAVQLLSASVRTFRVGDVDAVGAELSLKIDGRC